MLGSNWRALLATQQVTVGVKRKSESTSNGAAAAAASSASAASTAEAVVTPCVALDCEFVGTGADGTGDALARVSLVNFHGAVLLDRYVKPVDTVTDYRTNVSGVRPQHVHGKGAISFKQAQREVADLIKGRILVGHHLSNDMQVLLLSHPKHLIRDTARYKGLCPDRPRSLKKLAAEVLQLDIQRGEHNSVEDARCALSLYKHHRVQWEKQLFDKQKKKTFEERTGAAASSADAAPAAAAAAAAAASSFSSSSSTVTVTTSAVSVQRTSFTSKKSAKPDPAAARLEERRAHNVERNQRRKRMRAEQKAEKQLR